MIMARAAKIAGVSDIEKDAFDDIVDAFRSVVGEFGSGSVKIQRKNPRTQKFEYLGKEPISDGNFDAFIDQLRSDYPDGGEFLLNLVDGLGKTRSNKSLSIAPVPAKDRKDLPIVAANNNNDVMIAMMQMQSQQNQMMMQTQAQQSQTMMTAIMGMITAIVPAMSGNRESPSAMLRDLIDAQQKMNPPKEENGFDKTLDTIAKVRGIFPDGVASNNDEGFGGIIKSAMPMIGGLIAAAQNQPQPQPAPAQAQIRTPQVQHNPNTHQQPPQHRQPDTETAPQPNPQTEQEMEQLRLFQVYSAMLSSIKKMLDKRDNEGNFIHDTESVLAYLETKIDTEEIAETDVDNIVALAEQFPDQIDIMLTQFGVTDERHVTIIKSVLSEYTNNVDIGKQGERDSGHETVS